MIEARQFINAARSYLDVPFRHQGRDRTGLDCIGLAIRAAQDVGISVIDDTTYKVVPNPTKMLAHLMAHCQEIQRNEITVGTLLWIRFDSDPQHVALVTDAGMIHSYSTIGRVVEHGIGPAWKKRIVKAFHVRGLIYE